MVCAVPVILWYSGTGEQESRRAGEHYRSFAPYPVPYPTLLFLENAVSYLTEDLPLSRGYNTKYTIQNHLTVYTVITVYTFIYLFFVPRTL